MKESKFYKYYEDESKLKIYSDEIDNLLSKYNIKLENIELSKKTGNIICYINIEFKKLDFVKFEELLKKKIPLIVDIIPRKDYLILTFNIKTIELH